MTQMPQALKELMQKQRYHFVGKHSAVKICEYAANGMRDETLCYKNKFYGIRSWQCMQATTAMGCDLKCRFCWRLMPEEHGFKWNEINAVDDWDEPEDIIEGMLIEQKKVVSGYKGVADTELKMRRCAEANSPRHVALSLTGEPVFYPKMSSLLKSFHKKGISTFVVHNGTLPESIKKLRTLPTQFYISIQAPDKETYEKITRPNIPDAWERLIKSLKIMSRMKTRTALRTTLVKDLNMFNPEGYAELVGIAKPNYVEVKGFSFIGGSREPQRGLKYEDMPRHAEIKEFAKKLAELSVILSQTSTFRARSCCSAGTRSLRRTG